MDDAGKKLPERCEICQRAFKDPKALPCFHLVCRDCVSQLYVPGMSHLKCPVELCGKKFACEDPEMLPDALAIYHKKDLRSLRNKIDSKDVLCELCKLRDGKEKQADSSCEICRYICSSCRKLHQTKDKYSDHTVVTFLELSNQETDNLHYNVLKRMRASSFVQQQHQSRCKLHPGSQRESFCMDCKTLVCPKCIDADHSDHRYKALHLAAEECKDFINDKFPSISSSRNDLKKAVEAIKVNRVLIEDQENSLSSMIDATFDNLTTILQNRRQGLQSQLRDHTSSKLRKLGSQLKKVESLTGEMERMFGYLQDSLRTSTDYEILATFKDTESSVKENCQEASDTNLTPVEVPNMAFKCSARKELPDFCKKHLRVYQNEANPKMCTVEAIKMAETMSFTSVFVNVLDKNRRMCQNPQDVTARMKCSENDYESSALVRDGGMGRYIVYLCPEFRGEHEIFVEVNGNSIVGSPFTLKVHTSVHQLGSSQGCIDDINQPRGIILTPDGKLLACQWNGMGTIVEVDKLGRFQNKICINNGSMTSKQHLASLALDSSANLFVVVGVGERCGLIKCDRGGRIISSILGDGTESWFTNPRGVKVSSSNEVFVCDRDNHRIRVFDTNLSFLRDINLVPLIGWGNFQNNPKPNDLAFDSSGNMYVADYFNHCIHVLDTRERYHFSFSETKDGGKLAGPECIVYVSKSNYLYVSESQGHSVSIFHTSGESIMTFGKKGRFEAELNFPVGLVVDDYGSVFVCELYNNRVQVF